MKPLTARSPFADLSPAENAFLKLVASPREYARWAELVRKDWTERQERGKDSAGGAALAKTTQVAPPINQKGTQ